MPPKIILKAVTMNEATCIKCGHIWVIHDQKGVVVCPKCHKIYMHDPR